jgi:predicted short-subunit dehydrogenase-like oxidoreductase (DUF2520 family)
MTTVRHWLLRSGIVLSMAACAWTLDDAAFQKLMKQSGGLNGATKKALDAGDASIAAKNAAEYEKIFADIAAYYTEIRMNPDAVEISKKLQTHAKSLAAHSQANDLDTAKTDFAQLTSQCGACHNQYRVKNEDGTYGFK